MYYTNMLINQSVEYSESERLNVIFAALADPTRRAIISVLSKGAATVNELAAPFSITLQAVSRHLKVLERAGLIFRGHEAQWRPCTLNALTLREVSQWAETYRSLWEDSLENLAGYLDEIQAIEMAENNPQEMKNE
jgi:DNA-binding transcriptional ArsR family regulator